MKRARFILALVVICAAVAFYFRNYDTLYWPASAEGRIEEMASILRKIEGPARWCYPSINPKNTYIIADVTADLCFAKIEAVSPFIELGQSDYIKRYYRASVGSKFCEVTLSAVWNDDRIVGSDCYYGIFDQTDDEGIGMTDDPFG